jgi:hypothetical protein
MFEEKRQSIQNDASLGVQKADRCGTFSDERERSQSMFF